MVQRLLLSTITCGRHARSLPQAKEKAINDCGTANHIADDLERSSSEASYKGCSELSQAFAGVCGEQGWRTLNISFYALNTGSVIVIQYSNRCLSISFFSSCSCC